MSQCSSYCRIWLHVYFHLGDGLVGKIQKLGVQQDLCYSEQRISVLPPIPSLPTISDVACTAPFLPQPLIPTHTAGRQGSVLGCRNKYGQEKGQKPEGDLILRCSCSP